MSMPELTSVDRIVLMGFMGSGKTTVGRMLATHFGWQFTDLDLAVEERSGLTVPQMFAEFGEQHFRNAESIALHDVALRTQTVIALGGGAIEHAANQTLLRHLAGTSVIYLKAPFAQLQQRCSEQTARREEQLRPLLRDSAMAQLRFEIRQPIYQRLATLEVDTSNRSPEQVVEAIAQRLG